jgi:hypothetical protein
MLSHRYLLLVSTFVLAGALSYGCSSSSGESTGSSDAGSGSGEDTGSGVQDVFMNDICKPDKKLTTIPWAAPTAFKQHACTSTQTEAYVHLFKMTSEDGHIDTSSFRNDTANAACTKCIETDVNDSTHGPVITKKVAGTIQFDETNYGGCVANFDGDTSPSSCGAQLDAYNVCALAECGDCTDYFSGGKYAKACLEASILPGATCEPYWNSMVDKCEWQIDDAGGEASICATLNDFLYKWCGP